MPVLPFLSQPARPRRSGEWTSERAVTFIVTLAAKRSVTLAAREARMTRKSAYALKSRDPAFAAAWIAATKAGAKQRARPAPSCSKRDKVEEVEGPPVSPGQGDTGAAMPGAWRA